MSTGPFEIPDSAKQAIQAAKDEEERKLAEARQAGVEAAARRRTTIMGVTPPPDSNPEAPAGIESREDEIRLNRQQAVVWNAMSDGSWRTPHQLEEITGYGWASISARLRDFRKPKYGGHVVERENRGDGLYAYRLIVNPGGSP